MGASHKSAFCRITPVAAASGAGGSRLSALQKRLPAQRVAAAVRPAAFPQLELREAKSHPAVTLFLSASGCVDFICTQNTNLLRVSKSVAYFGPSLPFLFFVEVAEETGL